MARKIRVGDGVKAGGAKARRQHDCRRLLTIAARRARLPEYIIDELRGDTPKGVQDIYDLGSANHDDVNKIAECICPECWITPSFVVDRIKNGAESYNSNTPHLTRVLPLDEAAVQRSELSPAKGLKQMRF